MSKNSVEVRALSATEVEARKPHGILIVVQALPTEGRYGWRRKKDTSIGGTGSSTLAEQLASILHKKLLKSGDAMRELYTQETGRSDQQGFYEWRKKLVEESNYFFDKDIDRKLLELVTTALQEDPDHTVLIESKAFASLNKDIFPGVMVVIGVTADARVADIRMMSRDHLTPPTDIQPSAKQLLKIARQLKSHQLTRDLGSRLGAKVMSHLNKQASHDIRVSRYWADHLRYWKLYKMDFSPQSLLELCNIVVHNNENNPDMKVSEPTVEEIIAHLIRAKVITLEYPNLTKPYLDELAG